MQTLRDWNDETQNIRYITFDESKQKKRKCSVRLLLLALTFHYVEMWLVEVIDTLFESLYRCTVQNGGDTAGSQLAVSHRKCLRD